MSKPELRAILFDMDDTLIDWSEHTADWDEIRRAQLRPVYQELQNAGFLLPDLDEMVATYNDINQLTWLAVSPPDWVAPRQINVLKETMEKLGILVSDEEIKRLQQFFYWGPIPGVKAYPNAREVLKAFQQAGVKTGLMTNSSTPMWMRDRELERLDLLDYIDVRLTAGDVGHLKPHPRSFQAVLERMDVVAENAVFVGDRLFDDVGGAKNVGMRGVWLRHGDESLSPRVIPDAIIERLDQLPPLMDMWFPDWR